MRLRRNSTKTDLVKTGRSKTDYDFIETDLYPNRTAKFHMSAVLKNLVADFPESED